MASSNRHWPSMFKSKSTYTPHQDHHQWQSHGSNHILSSATNRSSPYTSGCDERTPEPKPRWNPKPEQIRILESIFNSGMVNPPRDEIRRIRARLQEYGQVGDANVFYWFQNRKSRSKNKNRHLPRTQNHPVKAATVSSSSSSDKSSSKSIEFFLNSPTVSVNQPYLGGGSQPHHHHHHHHQHHHGEFFQEPFFFPVVSHAPPTTASFSQGYCFPELGTMIDPQNYHGNDYHNAVSSSGMLLTDLMMNHQYGIRSTKNSKSKEVEEDNIMNMLSNSTTPPTSPSAPNLTVHPAPTTTIAPSTINNLQSVEEGVTGKCIVFINDVSFEMAVGPFNVKEAFGGDAVLIDSSGQTVVTNEWGITNQSLQHGGFYYLVRSYTYDNVGTIDLI